jgi:hypothetical protein
MFMAAVRTPQDWMDFPDWDRYWSEVLADKFWKARRMETLFLDRTTHCYLQGVEQRRGHRILLAGNGISPEPYAFVHAGCDVTVIDVSPVACRFLASLEVTSNLLAPMFPVYDTTTTAEGWTRLDHNVEKSCLRVAAEQRPGGSLSVVNADLFAFEPERPFHAIFSRRAYQGFPLDRRKELARRFFRWLQPGGIAFVEMLNIHHDRNPFEGPFRSAGFREVRNWSQERAGERCVLFWHGSG